MKYLLSIYIQQKLNSMITSYLYSLYDVFTDEHKDNNEEHIFILNSREINSNVFDMTIEHRIPVLNYTEHYSMIVNKPIDIVVYLLNGEAKFGRSLFLISENEYFQKELT